MSLVNPFVPEAFNVPEGLETNTLRLRMLSAADADKDYEAVMSSVVRLRQIFRPHDIWPVEDMTVEQNLQDLIGHEQEFLQRKSFAYTVVSLDETQCLGCVYIYPSRIECFDAEVYLWVRTYELTDVIDTELFLTVKQWMVDSWPFQRVAFPGREIDWETWESLMK
jgi:hypothetical protein